MKTRSQGFSLIELIVAITIIAALGATVLGLNTKIVQGSADAMTDMQRAAIAKGYLDEILSRSFTCAVASTARESFDCVDDYASISQEPVTDRFGAPVDGFDGYRARVRLLPTTTLRVQGMSAVPSAQMRIVEVEVTDPYGGRTRLRGARTRH